MPHTVILGAGIIGVSTAYFLSCAASRPENHAITIIDPCPPACGASGKAGGFIARNWVSQATASLEDLSFNLHQELAEQHDGAKNWGYRRTKALAVIGGDGNGGPIDPIWRDRHKNIKRTPYSGELKWVRPGFVKSMDILGDPNDFAQCHPYLFTLFLLEKAKSKGVQFVLGRPSVLSTEDGRVSGIDFVGADMQTSTLSCDSLVIAAGPWTGPMTRTLLPKPIHITSYGGNSVVLRPNSSKNLTADGLFLTLNLENISYYPEIFPRPSGEVYLAGINESRETPLPPTPQDAVPQKSAVNELKRIADEILPEYTVEMEQLCFRPMTDRGLPFIGPVHEVDGVYVGAGHSFFGIMLGPGTGKILSEMVLGEELSIDVTEFSLPT